MVVAPVGAGTCWCGTRWCGHPLVRKAPECRQMIAEKACRAKGACTASSTAQPANIVKDDAKHRRNVDRNYTIRKYELDHFIVHHVDVRCFSNVFLLGNSEGEMVAARYHHPCMDAKLTGRIIAAYACGLNSFACGLSPAVRRNSWKLMRWLCSPIEIRVITYPYHMFYDTLLHPAFLLAGVSFSITRCSKISASRFTPLAKGQGPNRKLHAFTDTACTDIDAAIHASLHRA